MIDKLLLRESPESVIQRIGIKDPTFDVRRLIELDVQVRALRNEVEELRHKKNEVASQGARQVTPELRERSAALSKSLKEKEAMLVETERSFENLYLACPNLPSADLPVGGKEVNKVVQEVGVKPSFSFEPKHHLDLGTALGWLDFQSGASIAGSQFPLYRGEAVRLMYGLTMFMLKNNMKHGFEPVLPPAVVNEQSLVVASNFPRFRDQVYEIPADDLYLIPTAEVSLANVYRNQIIEASRLPIRLTAWTSCFRREAGGYGATERGLIRVHQFEKVELFTFCEPDHSAHEQERMLACAQDILNALGLTYRVSLLATQDCSFPSAKTYDLEVWMPGQKAWYEVSSISNCTDFQARRGGIRYRPSSTEKPALVHTLNGSSLALSRVMVALIETYQQADGTVRFPTELSAILSL